MTGGPDLRRTRLRPHERALHASGLLICAMERVGLVWDVVRISPERQAAKLAPAAR